ncbi:MAG: hypothetical protein Q4G54_08865 [Pelistega sp.]|nr:hypothetical protein [Pelistega sp.]
MYRSALKAQSGQALLLGMLFLAILSIALIAMYNNGRLIAARLKQTHAVDAAAYSGALIQARALNMQAYINLAQVGHQMAMAHLVTLGSWARWSSTEGMQLTRANPPAYVIAMHFGAKHGLAYGQASRARAIASIANQNNQLHQQFAEHDRIAQQVLARVSNAVHKSMEEARDNAIQEVLQQNYPDRIVLASKILKSSSLAHEAESVIGGTELQAGSSLYSASPPSASSSESPLASPLTSLKHFMPLLEKSRVESGALTWTVAQPSYQRFGAVYRPKANYRSLLTEVAAVYDFLDARDFTHKSLLPVSMRCPTWRHELRRRGHTILNGQGNWQSMDTQSYHALRSNKWIGCYYREYPMGWGWIPGQSGSVPAGMEYAEDPPDDFSSQDFWRWVQSATNWNIFTGSSNPLANSRAIRDRQRWSGGGLVPYLDIRDANKQANLAFSLSLRQYDVQGHTLNTTSSAQTFFERPTKRRDGRYERPNFWHPYWQARLVDPSIVEGESN